MVLAAISQVQAMLWDNAVDLNDDFRLHWTIKGPEITFEVQVATLGYIGIGFSSTGAMDNADMAIGWVDGEKAHFQVREILIIISIKCNCFFACSNLTLIITVTFY